MDETKGLAREGFDLDLKHGQARECAFARLMLESHTTRVTVEHKSDGKARSTGNVFIEYRQKGRPSGLATTASDFYAIEWDYECWIVVPTARLKLICKRVMERHPERKCVRGGDFGKYEGVLLKLTELF